MRPFFRQRTAGLAQCDGQIALACLTHTHHTLQIENLAIVPLPATSEAITHATRTLVTQTGARGWPAAIALPEPLTIQREIRMASTQNESDRDAELRDHLADYLPGNPAFLCLDHAVIQPGEKEHQILLIAAREDTVYTAVSQAENAGLVVRIVDIDQHAKNRALDLQPLSALPCADAINKSLLDTPTTALLIALGLAMRRCPTW